MKVLITAGAVYGPLDDNKLVSNRSRGIWATKYAQRLWLKDHEVTTLIPDTMDDLGVHTTRGSVCIKHKGFDEYRRICKELAPQMDAAIMAAAVVNWIPAEPVRGKMKTEGYKPGDRIDIPFYLAPRVIEEMKVANPKLTLVGCKMLSGSEKPALIEAAYQTLLHSHANVIVANDLQGLRTKHLVYQDRTVVTYADKFDKFFDDLDAVLADVHYKTNWVRTTPMRPSDATRLFDEIVEAHRAQFVKRDSGSDRVFGAVLVRDPTYGWLVSPREKDQLFSSEVATRVVSISRDAREVNVDGPNKATLNAPLLVRVAEKYKAKAVLHLHEQLPNVPTVAYAPPGTVRDNDRDIPAATFNIEGHGFVKVLV
jgi:DNA / pantothenate metabolism flavoprotein